MITYIKMKRNEWKLKCMFYGALIKTVESRKDTADIIRKLYKLIKETPNDNLRQQFIKSLAETIHNANSKMEE